MAAVAFSVAMTSCNNDDDDDNNTPSTPVIGTVTVSQDIAANTTWTKNNIYVLDGRIKVRPNVTLTIEPGTIIKGEQGQAADATVLMVMRDAKINAVGTPTEPIIFTSVFMIIRHTIMQFILFVFRYVNHILVDLIIVKFYVWTSSANYNSLVTCRH